MMKFIAMRAISLCWEYGIMNLSFWEWRRSLLNVGDKYVDTYIASLDCKRIQNKVLSMSVVSSLIGSMINAIEAEPIIAKWKSRAWSSDIYGHYWNNVWWIRWFKWSCKRPVPHVCWINIVPLCNISGKWHELKYAVNRILKIRMRSYEDSYLWIINMQHINLVLDNTFLMNDYSPM
jgi:hypothetical protein